MIILAWFCDTYDINPIFGPYSHLIVNFSLIYDTLS